VATSPLLFFFAPRRTFSFLFILSAQNPPPPQICNDLIFYCLASSVNILFLYSLVLPQQSFSRLYCPLKWKRSSASQSRIRFGMCKTVTPASSLSASPDL
jgi:hypothetical protein